MNNTSFRKPWTWCSGIVSSPRIDNSRFRSSRATCSSTHVEDYGHWIPQDPAGKKRENHRKFLGFFPVDSSQFPVLSGRKRSEMIGKNPKIFRWEYCFHVPAISDAFLPEPARNFWPGDIVFSHSIKNIYTFHIHINIIY